LPSMAACCFSRVLNRIPRWPVRGGRPRCPGGIPNLTRRRRVHWHWQGRHWHCGTVVPLRVTEAGGAPATDGIMGTARVGRRRVHAAGRGAGGRQPLAAAASCGSSPVANRHRDCRARAVCQPEWHGQGDGSRRAATAAVKREAAFHGLSGRLKARGLGKP